MLAYHSGTGMIISVVRKTFRHDKSGRLFISLEKELTNQ